MTRAIDLALGHVAAPPLGSFGRVTVDWWAAHKRRTGKEIRVYVDGVDVTTRCVVANDRSGYALLYKHDEAGRPYVVGLDGNAAREVVRGKGRIVMSEVWP